MSVELVHEEDRPVEERVDELEAAIRVLLSHPVDVGGAPTLVAIDRDDLVLVVAGLFGLLALVLAVKL